ncbi:MAG: epoxyqueuosine reductase QueH [Christensenellales bacterium]|nr:epoxyqueuosine reductase QueH [Christensenellales bacterium]
MKTNYRLEMERVMKALETRGVRPRLLLHSCCAPCSSAVLETLDSCFDVTVYYYNPNIAPREEFWRRYQEQQRLIEEMSLRFRTEPICGDEDGDAFAVMARGLESEKEGGARCEKCFRMRLGKTAQQAKARGFEYFTTTLSVSPLKNARMLNEIGAEMAGKFDVPFLYADFKKKNGYLRSLELSRVHGLYRQDYCGCIYSRRERDERKKEKGCPHEED